MSISLKANSDNSGSIYVGGVERLKIGTDGILTSMPDSGPVTISTSQIITAGPAFSAYVSSSTTLNANQHVKLNYATEEYDTHNCYNTSTSTFTPNVAGIYLITAAIQYNSTSTIGLISIFKNGVRLLDGDYQNIARGSQVKVVSGLVSCNGSTDTIQIHAYSSVSAGIDTSSNPTRTKFDGFMIRPL